MTTISSTSNAASGTSTTTATNPYANLGMSDFLKLLTTQMKDQDPTQPVDNTQMLAQMAQFSSLSGIQASNTTLTSIASKLDTLIAAQTAGANAAATTGATTATTTTGA
jgi:flagellar basal-body rod modification protein FlgD